MKAKLLIELYLPSGVVTTMRCKTKESFDAMRVFLDTLTSSQPGHVTSENIPFYLLEDKKQVDTLNRFIDKRWRDQRAAKR